MALIQELDDDRKLLGKSRASESSEFFSLSFLGFFCELSLSIESFFLHYWV